jgi:hypothetical protein
MGSRCHTWQRAVGRRPGGGPSGPGAHEQRIVSHIGHIIGSPVPETVEAHIVRPESAYVPVLPSPPSGGRRPPVGEGWCGEAAPGWGVKPMPTNTNPTDFVFDDDDEDEDDDDLDRRFRPLKKPPDPWPEPKYAPTHCIICDAPITQPRVGRPRLTCSDRCRQRAHRLGRSWRTPAEQLEAERRKFVRFIDRTVADLIRRYGPPPPDDPERYHLIAYRIHRKYPVPYLLCAFCGRPFLLGVFGPKPSYCSRQCIKRALNRKYHKRKHGYHTEPRPYTPEEQARIDYRLSRGLPLRTCPECGRYFFDDKPGRIPKYCSTRCRQRAWYYRRRPLYRTCHHCGRRYRITNHQASKQKYCSRKCYYAARYRRRMQSRQSLT